MLIALSELKPSPWNPKKPFTKKERNALIKGIKEFGFQRSLCVCRDFESGEGFFVLDGNDALELLRELGKKKVDCYNVEKVTDLNSLQKFIAAYSISKTPLYSEFATALGKLDFSDFTGLNYSKFSFDIKIDDFGGLDRIDAVPALEREASEPESVKSAPSKNESAGSEGRQTQFFLTLPSDCIDKLRNFVKTKAFNASKTEAIAEKIDAMNDTQFLENILQIVL